MYGMESFTITVSYRKVYFATHTKNMRSESLIGAFASLLSTK